MFAQLDDLVAAAELDRPPTSAVIATTPATIAPRRTR